MAVEADILNAFDAASFLGVHVETLRKLARRNEVPCFKIGKDWRFRREALVRWADGQRPVRSSGDSHTPVIVIDDEEKVCRATVGALQRFGVSARYATSGREGLELVSEGVPDLIMLDLQMPSMNGPQFLAELRQTHASLPVVIITAYPNSNLMQKAMQYAPVLLLAKPLDRKLLERTVRSLLGEKMSVSRTG